MKRSAKLPSQPCWYKKYVYNITVYGYGTVCPVFRGVIVSSPDGRKRGTTNARTMHLVHALMPGPFRRGTLVPICECGQSSLIQAPKLRKSASFVLSARPSASCSVLINQPPKTEVHVSRSTAAPTIAATRVDAATSLLSGNTLPPSSTSPSAFPMLSTDVRQRPPRGRHPCHPVAPCPCPRGELVVLGS